jgi:hypothetical protein
MALYHWMLPPHGPAAASWRLPVQERERVRWPSCSTHLGIIVTETSDHSVELMSTCASTLAALNLDSQLKWTGKVHHFVVKCRRAAVSTLVSDFPFSILYSTLRLKSPPSPAACGSILSPWPAPSVWMTDWTSHFRILDQGVSSKIFIVCLLAYLCHSPCA